MKNISKELFDKEYEKKKDSPDWKFDIKNKSIKYCPYSYIVETIGLSDYDVNFIINKLNVYNGIYVDFKYMLEFCKDYKLVDDETTLFEEHVKNILMEKSYNIIFIKEKRSQNDYFVIELYKAFRNNQEQ